MWSRRLYFSNKLNCFPHEYVWDEYPSTISILPYTWNNDVFRDKKGFWYIKITNQIISLLKRCTDLVKEHSFLHSRLHVWPFMNILPHQSRVRGYLSTQITLLIWKNIAPWSPCNYYLSVFSRPLAWAPPCYSGSIHVSTFNREMKIILEFNAI